LPFDGQKPHSLSATGLDDPAAHAGAQLPSTSLPLQNPPSSPSRPRTLHEPHAFLPTIGPRCAVELDSAGRRVVEKKEDTKKAIGRSPDDIDALNLAYFERDFSIATITPEEPPRYDRERREYDPDDPRNHSIFDDENALERSAQWRRNLFGIRDIRISEDGLPYG
jgi:hypothetical protein